MFALQQQACLKQVTARRPWQADGKLLRGSGLCHTVNLLLFPFCGHALCFVAVFVMFHLRLYKFYRYLNIFLKKCQLHRWQLHIVLHTAAVMVWLPSLGRETQLVEQSRGGDVAFLQQWQGTRQPGTISAEGRIRRSAHFLSEAQHHTTMTSGREFMASFAAKMNT